MTALALRVLLNLPGQSAFGLQVSNLSKSFGTFKALENVTLDVRASTFHVLLGENGAGKSTLVKCLMGYHPPDTGAIRIAGQEARIHSPRDAHALGLGMVYQHFMLAPQMSVAENFVLAKDVIPSRIRWQLERKALNEFLTRMPFTVPLDAQVADLSSGEKQKLEILKLLYLGRRFLILDEPTSVMTPEEADEVLGLLKRETEAGTLTVLMISHKFREVKAFADEVTVLRKGQNAGSGSASELSVADMSYLMMGKRVETSGRYGRAPRAPVPHTADANGRLSIRHLNVDSDRGHAAVIDVSLDVPAGHIVGVAGVSGSGQRELVEVLAGQRAKRSGDVYVDSQPYRGTMAEARRLKVNVLPEEPLHNAGVGTMSVADNMLMRRFSEPPFSLGGWWINTRAVGREAETLIARYDVQTRSARAPLATLSGGNIQRAILARELDQTPRVLIAANPCFGLDFSASRTIRTQLVAARDAGTAVLLISEDLDELLDVSDTLVVMVGGKLVYKVATEDAKREVIGHYMAGGEHADLA